MIANPNQIHMYTAEDGLAYPEKLIPKESNESNPVLDGLPIKIDVANMEALSPAEFTLTRREGFGGSDSSVLLGVNPYTPLSELIKQKASRELLPEEKVSEMQVRFRTIGDMTCTGATVSTASNIKEIIDELGLATKEDLEKLKEDLK